MRKATYILIAALLAITTVSCAPAAPRPAPRPQVVEEEVVREAPVEKVVEAPMPAMGAEEAALAPVGERMIIRNVELAMYVQDVEQSFEEIQALTEDMGGYVTSANTWHQEEHLRARLTLRIPAERLDEALKEIRAMATEVERESTSGEDVTEEYTDLEARLRNLEAAEEELRALLKTVRQRNGEAEDILAVYRELTKIRGQIEQIKGRMQYLEQMSALATVNIELTPDVLSKPLTVGRWRPKGTAANAVRTLIQVLRFIGKAGIWLIIVGLPILILVAIPIPILILAIRAWRRRG
ncbi:MAG: DUF4349 domain-containing protein [Chloroflexota bacterium]|nr:DUF4349 domain-containing protein [Chloroflexota bacterium]